MSLHQLIYYSRNKAAGDDREMLRQLRDIVSVSQANNSRDEITGALIFDKHWFVQVLEGEKDRIEATYNRIGKDPRHGTITLVETRSIPHRQFGEWAMGGTMRTPEVQEIFLRHGIGGALDPTRLKGGAILALALDLKAYELQKKAAVARPS
jgi:hypothetical protein